MQPESSEIASGRLGLREIRGYAGARRTIGLPDEVIAVFAQRDPQLRLAIDEAVLAHRALRDEYPSILALDEPAQIEVLQSGYVNFYSMEAVNPYVALAARGPWIVTSKGAVVHDVGGYGMLGLGHAPPGVLEALNGPQVMANVMTASFSQLRLVEALQREIGQRRPAGCPFARFVCLNSGSETVTLAARIADINAKLQTDPGGRHAGRTVKVLALRGSFHGRTHRPAQFSGSTLAKYVEHLASFRGRTDLIQVSANDVAGLRAAFARAVEENCFIEAMFLEPVMGEGNPGLAMTRDFYDAAVELTRQHDSLLVIDSIQAGLRAHGCLSIVDYPGFEDASPPDLETYSKALNAGQFPLSVLALTERAAGLYRTGVYGNTMTTNPRALDVACAVLEAITPALRANIRRRGAEFLEKLSALADELGGPITRVQGTGLLISCELAPGLKSYGHGSVEEYMRLHGVGVIHGGPNSVRLTPHFAINSAEIDLIVGALRQALVALHHA